VDPDANIIFGAVIDERLGEEVVITVIATGFERDVPAAKAAPRQAPLPTIAPPKEAEVRELHPKPKVMDRPAFLRRGPAARDLAERADRSDRPMLASEDEWDVPTFLRRQAD